jgi:hypothetical protein
MFYLLASFSFFLRIGERGWAVLAFASDVGMLQRKTVGRGWGGGTAGAETREELEYVR